MIKMDFEGIKWVGNVYQKFEAMCLEVEEVIYEDTVKYVENQVQAVGASVKKFYSDVMQDLSPLSSIDPVKVAAIDLSLNPYADFSIHNKPKRNSKKDTVTMNKPVPENSIVKSEAKKNCAMDLLSGQNRVVVSDKKSKGVIKRKSTRENNMSLGLSKSFASLSRDLNSTTCKMGKDDDVASDLVETKLCRDKGSDSSLDSFASVESSSQATADTNSPSKSFAKKERHLSDTCAQGLPDVSSAETHGAAINNEVDSLMGSYFNCDPKNGGSAHEDNFSPTGDYNVNVIEINDDKCEPWPESIQEFDESNCVIVERENLSVTTRKGDKPKSYKRNIQRAFSSKLLTRKQEYKELVVQHRGLSTRLDQKFADSSPELIDEQKSGPHQSSESDWELL